MASFGAHRTPTTKKKAPLASGEFLTPNKGENVKSTGIFRVAVLLLLLTSLTPIASKAQTAATGAILGAVTDPGGGLESRQRMVETDECGSRRQEFRLSAITQGQYAFPWVAPGTYSVTGRLQGFRTFTVNNVNVQVNVSATVNLKLEIGEISSKVEVSAEQGQIDLQTADASVGDVIGTEPLLHLPTRLRQAQELLLPSQLNDTPDGKR